MSNEGITSVIIGIVGGFVAAIAGVDYDGVVLTALTAGAAALAAMPYRIK